MIHFFTQDKKKYFVSSVQTMYIGNVTQLKTMFLFFRVFRTQCSIAKKKWNQLPE